MSYDNGRKINIKVGDFPMHALFNFANSQPRTGTQPVLQNFTLVNDILAEKGIIVEPESSRGDITPTIFSHLTSIEDIMALKDQSNYLKGVYVSKTAELESLKKQVQTAVKERSADTTVEEMIK